MTPPGRGAGWPGHPAPPGSLARTFGWRGSGAPGVLTMYFFTAALVLLTALAVASLLPEQSLWSVRLRRSGLRLEALVTAMLLIGLAAIGIVVWHWLRLLAG